MAERNQRYHDNYDEHRHCRWRGSCYVLIARNIGEKKAEVSEEDISYLTIGLIDVTTESVHATAHVKAHDSFPRWMHLSWQRL